MAIREKGKSWQVYWNNPYTGKRQSKTFATKEEALKEDSLVKHRMKFERESFRPLAEEPEETKPTLEAVYMAYLKEKQFSSKSLVSHLASMRDSLRLLGQMPVDRIGKPELGNVLGFISRKRIKPVTVRNRMRILYTVMRWAYANGFCALPLFPKLPCARYERFIPPSPQELSDMLEVAPDHIRRVIIIGSQCGARVGPCELFGLSWADVDLGRGVLRIHGSHKNADAPWREVPIRSALMAVFENWARADTAIGVSWLIHYKGKPVNSIKKAWGKTLAAAGITRRIRPYDLRHSFATELIAAGVDIGTVANLMGHNSPNMLLKHYQYVLDEQKKRAVESLPDVVMCPGACALRNEDVANAQ